MRLGAHYLWFLASAGLAQHAGQPFLSGPPDAGISSGSALATSLASASASASALSSAAASALSSAAASATPLAQTVTNVATATTLSTTTMDATLTVTNLVDPTSMVLIADAAVPLDGMVTVMERRGRLERPRIDPKEPVAEDELSKLEVKARNHCKHVLPPAPSKTHKYKNTASLKAFCVTVGWMFQPKTCKEWHQYREEEKALRKYDECLYHYEHNYEDEHDGAYNN